MEIKTKGPVYEVHQRTKSKRRKKVKFDFTDLGGPVHGLVVSTEENGGKGGTTNKNGRVLIPAEALGDKLYVSSFSAEQIVIPLTKPPSGRYTSNVKVEIYAVEHVEGKEAVARHAESVASHPLSDGGTKVTEREEETIKRAISFA